MLGFGAALALQLVSCAWIGSEEWNDRLDVDADGVPWPDDCDDSDPSVAASTTWFLDADTDGYGDPDVPTDAKQCHRPDGYAGNSDDCDDADIDAHPGAIWYADLDSDGYGDESSNENPPSSSCLRPAGLWAARLGDCDDADAAVNPAATEVCDGRDGDCDGIADAEEGDLPVAMWCIDTDGDGFGDNASEEKSCEWHEAPWSQTCGDCDDSIDTVHPGATETCDGIDQDCDDSIDEEASDLVQVCLDLDADGYGDPATGVYVCTPEVGYTSDCTDCDDTVGVIHPGADETCATTNDDCDVTPDDVGPAATWSCDEDGDGIGGDQTESGCSEPVGGCVGTWVRDGGDCDDTNKAVSPRVAEDFENGVDDDCDGRINLRWTSGMVDLLTAGAIEFDGENDQAWIGCAFAPGDYNLDGRDDMAISGCSMEAQGAAYLIAGDSKKWPKGGTLEAGSDFPRFVGEYYEMTGRKMAGGVDMDGDGCDDVALGAPLYGGDAGRAVVLPGCAGKDWDAATIIKPGDGYGAGDSIAAASDDTGDSVLVVTAPVYAGFAWLYTSPIPSGDLSAADAAVEIVDYNFPYHWVGTSSSLADFDGDGLIDLALSARIDASTGEGFVYLVDDPIGTDSGTVEIGSIADGTISEGPATGHFFGGNMTALGDIDGDGYDDLAVQSNYNEAIDFTDTYEGTLNLFLGSKGFTTASMSSDADRVAWFEGTMDAQGVGSSVAVGDVDGNGSVDLLMGAGWGDAAGFDQAGQAWLYYDAAALGGSYSLDPAAPSSDATFAISKFADGRIGRAVALADMDDDGLDDMWIGSQSYPDFTLDDTGEPGAAFLLLSGSP